MKRLFLLLILSMLLMPAVYAESPEEQENPVKGYVALTFDDGPSGALTERLLDGLKARNARATFFLCGYRMEQYPELLDRYVAEGHELGVHSTVHEDLTKLTGAQVRQDMMETVQRIFVETGTQPKLMRPPGGAWNKTVAQEAEAEGMSIILWSVDPKDWASGDSGQVLHAMAVKTGGGDVILMHDMSKSSVQAALALVDQMQRQGYVFVTVSELAELTGTELIPGKVYEEFTAKE